MMCCGRDRLFFVGVEYDNVRVRPDGDSPLAREQPEEFRGRGRGQFDETIQAYFSARYAAVIDQAHAVLYPRPAVRDLREVIAPKLFLLLETERAVVRRDHLQVVAREPLPQLLLIPLFAERGRH